MVLFYVISIRAYSKEKLRIGLFESRPFAYKESAKIKGITKQLADKLFKNHFDVTYVVMPYARIIDQISKENIDVTIMYSNKKIQKNTIEVAETLGNDNIVVSLIDQKISRFEDLKNKKIAHIRAANYGKEFYTVDYATVEVLNYDQSIKLLMSKRVQAIFISSSAWKFYLKSLKFNQEDFNVLSLNFKLNSIFVKKSMEQKTINKIIQINKKLLLKYPEKKLDSLL
jgi:ABC-type amino acid transport substrate-binding protein